MEDEFLTVGVAQLDHQYDKLTQVARSTYLKQRTRLKIRQLDFLLQRTWITKEIKSLVEGWPYMRADVVIREYERVQERRVARQFEQGPQGDDKKVEDPPLGERNVKLLFYHPQGLLRQRPVGLRRWGENKPGCRTRAGQSRIRRNAHLP